MTIQKAIRSGKPMRRKAWGGRGFWFQISIDGSWIMLTAPENEKFNFGPCMSDILADDWELKP